MIFDHFFLKMNRDVDDLIELQDDILVCTLSLLPLKEAVRLSVLSRSWRNLWMKMPKLEFDWRKSKRSTFRPLFEEIDVKTHVNSGN